ncbi:SMI1/KNR4 family protein [Amycolatopsis keratiniphila]|uniref:Knr4/Smi1-like domain-containing protein n=1 Tax=Amycolatopsis keratiniphila TaxID=129921 RepID=R4T7Y0_9PSEU|nr:SMI1/KNR4 family protein [Amycolatopsis keratiniphila]AGM08451.1 hypothetical protein AORI_5868 [Amycolatopsis keratiniphila]
MSVEASERLIELIRANEDISNHADGWDEATISAAERTLGAALPHSYRRLLQEFGTWDVAGEEFIGPLTETLEMRRDYGMPAELILVAFDGMGGVVALDSSQPNDAGEYPVLGWVHHNEPSEKLGDDFGSFALALCARSLYRGRVKLPVGSAGSVAQDLLGLPGARRKPPTVDEVVAAVRCFEAIGFAVPDGVDTDGFLFQYGEVNWGSEPMFAVGFVRQMEIVDADGEHAEYSQVGFEFRCRVDADLRSLGSRAVWWFRGDGVDFADWLASVTGDPVWRILRKKEIAEFVLSQESV